jgi:DNA-binding transcriptional MerR regulator
MTTATSLGIRDVSELTGLSIDTLRWYEKEGLLPVVGRSSDGRRTYTPAAVGFVRLVQALRRTGMPVAEVRAFVQIGAGTVATHPTRLALLEQQSAAVQRRIAELQQDLLVVHRKIDNYRDLIARGVDCEDEMG